MDFTSERIAAFVDIWAHEFGEELTPDMARLEATRLMELYLILLRRQPGDTEPQEPRAHDDSL